LIGRMLERGTEHTIVQPALPGTVIAARFARDPQHFARVDRVDRVEGAGQ
jgi:hypothetical protein